MKNKINQLPITPSLKISEQDEQQTIDVIGDWNLQGIAETSGLRHKIKKLGNNRNFLWNLDKVNILDSAGAFLLWSAWGERLPENLNLQQDQQKLFAQWQHREIPATTPKQLTLITLGRQYNKSLSEFCRHILTWFTLLGQFVLDIVYLLSNPDEIPWKEISFTIYKVGVQALLITALLGFQVGMSLSYLSALQLQRFGAEIYIIDLLGLSIFREIGPLLTAILLAGRSCSSMTAQIGIMRVNQELDALAAMGVSHSRRIALPKIIAMAIALPLLVVWNELVALLGGMTSAALTLDISFQQFLDNLPDAVPVANYYISLLKSFVFGLVIAMIACHFGFHIKPNTESLGNETTNSVVTAIIAVIMLDTIFAILFRNVGFP